MAVKFQQWRDGLDDFLIDTGCTFDADFPSREARYYSQIASATDSADSATGIVNDSAKLPAADEGRIRGYIKFPATVSLAANSTILIARNSGGLQIFDLYLNSAEDIGLFSATNILNSTSSNNVPDITNPQDLEHLFEIAWKKNDFLRLWYDGSVLIEFTGLTGATGNAVPATISFGIDHYDGSSGVSWASAPLEYRLWQVSDDSSTPLSDPSEDAPQKINAVTSPMIWR